MKVIAWIGDMSWKSSLEYRGLASKFVAERVGVLQSARMVLCNLGFDETESNEAVGMLAGTEQK